MNVYHRGDPLFLYTRFQDQDGNLVPAGQVMVRILHERGNSIVEDLSWTNMQQLNNNEYSYTWQIPLDADYGFYEVLYQGNIAGSQAENVEEFHVIGESEQFSDTVKVYGYVHQSRTGTAIISAEVIVKDSTTGDEVYKTYTDDGGLWEAYVYPGQYEFSFNKVNFDPYAVTAQINSQNNELQFDNVTLNVTGQAEETKGSGIYTVKDQYVTKEGFNLDGLTISAASVMQPQTIIAQTVTDDHGMWELYLDPGMYLLRASGTVFGNAYDKLFRLKINDSGNFKFEDITLNVAKIVPVETVTDGTGSITVTDSVFDSKNNPILDVVVTVTQTDSNGKVTTIAETTTDVDGTWTVHLNPGTYTFTYSNPQFHEFQESRTIN